MSGRKDMDVVPLMEEGVGKFCESVVLCARGLVRMYLRGVFLGGGGGLRRVRWGWATLGLGARPESSRGSLCIMRRYV